MATTTSARERWREAYRYVRRMRRRTRGKQGSSEMSRWAREIFLRTGAGQRPAILVLRDLV